MSKNAPPNYERMFWRIAVRYLPHHTLLVWAIRRNNRNLSAYLDKRMRRKLQSDAIKASPPEVLAEYKKAADHIELWHGTGRFQYSQGKVIDTLQTIIDNGVLKPKHDVYSIIVSGKEMTTVSVTRLRIIARSYADTHGLGILEPNRYGSALWWVAYYYNLCHVEIIAKHGLAFTRNWSTFNQKSTDTSGERTWGKKVNSKAKSVWDTFGLGSDIPGNYPILFGIKGDVETAELPKSMKKWEVRITSPVKLSDLSHIEVPEVKVEETKKLLLSGGYTVPVFPIEVGEFAASQKSLADLLYKNKDF